MAAGVAGEQAELHIGLLVVQQQQFEPEDCSMWLFLQCRQLHIELRFHRRREGLSGSREVEESLYLPV